jgi:signal transduction histidine kinase
MLSEYQQTEADAEDRERLQRKWEELDIDYIVSDVDLLLEQSRKGCERINKIVLGLSRFSHVEKTDVESFDRNALVENALELLQNEIKHKAELQKELSPMPRIVGLPNQLSQVFVNIIVNALQAMEDFGKIEIKTSYEDECAFVRIEDNGPGMEKETVSRIFDPFYTTKPVGKGTGLGLSISYEIVKNHGGDIRVESTPGKGTAFTVFVPRQGSFEGEGQ